MIYDIFECLQKSLIAKTFFDMVGLVFFYKIKKKMYLPTLSTFFKSLFHLIDEECSRKEKLFLQKNSTINISQEVGSCQPKNWEKRCKRIKNQGGKNLPWDIFEAEW